MGRVHAYLATSTAAETRTRRVTVGRVIDVVVGGLLLALALPLMAVLALAVRRSSNGPVLHRDRIRDRHGRAVEVLSFRTTLDGGSTRIHQRMRAVIGARDEVPVTGIGRVLRATRADRLPRLFSVVAGHVSLLG
jgi:putative colanic acid biosynthesis UDP-glucose lipid carrier transferase